MLVIALALMREVVNSSLDAFADHLHPSQRPSIKIMAAARSCGRDSRLLGQRMPCSVQVATEQYSHHAARNRRRLLLSLMVLALHAGAAVQPPAQSTIVDRQSGVAFPVALTPPGGGGPHQLTGTATRERTIFRVKVYAYGLFVDAGAGRRVLAAFAGRPAAALDRDRAFFQRLLEMRIPMTLRLVITRDVAGEAIGNAFDEALKPRLAGASTELNRPDIAAALERFRGYFNLRELARGTEIVFSCSPGGRLNASVNAESRPEIQSPALCSALFDVYLGEKPVSTDGRRSLVSGFPALLAGSR